MTEDQIEQWATRTKPSAERAATSCCSDRERIADWNELGRTLCGSFLEVADRVGARA